MKTVYTTEEITESLAQRMKQLEDARAYHDRLDLQVLQTFSPGVCGSFFTKLCWNWSGKNRVYTHDEIINLCCPNMSASEYQTSHRTFLDAQVRISQLKKLIRVYSHSLESGEPITHETMAILQYSTLASTIERQWQEQEQEARERAYGGLGDGP